MGVLKTKMVSQLSWQSKGLKILVSLVRFPVTPRRNRNRSASVAVFSCFERIFVSLYFCITICITVLYSPFHTFFSDSSVVDSPKESNYSRKTQQIGQFHQSLTRTLLYFRYRTKFQERCRLAACKNLGKVTLAYLYMPLIF